MNLWKLVGANRLNRIETPLPEPVEGKIRVRISKVLVSDVDAAVASGKLRVKYPLIPGRYAVGIVTEETGHPLFPKGTHIVPHAIRAPLDTGAGKRDFSEDDFLVCGMTADGFLTDFTLLSPDEMTPLPSSVGDDNALLLHQVAVAKAIVDKLEAKKGQHIAVVGANLIGILVCQLLIYQQAAPILADADETRLAFARGCGIYYTVPADDGVVDAVASHTGGRLADGAVFVADTGKNDPALAFSLCAQDANVVMCASGIDKVVADLDTAMRRRLTVHCVMSGADYIETAINLVANKAVDLNNFRILSAKAETATQNFVKFAAGKGDVGAVTVYDLL